MLRLDFERYRAAMGNTKPNVHGSDDEFPRRPLYDFDGHLYDADGWQTGPGMPADTPATQSRASVSAPAPAAASDDAPAGMSPAELLRQADDLKFAIFKKHAKAILGNTCPAGKEAILAALQSAIEAYTARMAKRNGQAPFRGMTWDGATGGEEAANGAAAETAPAAAPQAATSQGKNGVDLAAWARGQADYLFGEVQKALRTQHHVQFTERRDALNFLIDQGVITAAQARPDIK